MEAFLEARRASRHGVMWPARIRRVDEEGWQAGKTLNLSVTGVLLETRCRYRIGDRVEVEIEFLVQPHASTIVAGVGHVVRADYPASGIAAIQFSVECAPSKVTNPTTSQPARPR